MQHSKREQTALKLFSHLEAFQRVMMVKWVLELGARAACCWQGLSFACSTAVYRHIFDIILVNLDQMDGKCECVSREEAGYLFVDAQHLSDPALDWG